MATPLTSGRGSGQVDEDGIPGEPAAAGAGVGAAAAALAAVAGRELPRLEEAGGTFAPA